MAIVPPHEFLANLDNIPLTIQYLKKRHGIALKLRADLYLYWSKLDDSFHTQETAGLFSHNRMSNDEHAMKVIKRAIMLTEDESLEVVTQVSTSLKCHSNDPLRLAYGKAMNVDIDFQLQCLNSIDSVTFPVYHDVRWRCITIWNAWPGRTWLESSNRVLWSDSSKAERNAAFSLMKKWKKITIEEFNKFERVPMADTVGNKIVLINTLLKKTPPLDRDIIVFGSINQTMPSPGLRFEMRGPNVMYMNAKAAFFERNLHGTNVAIKIPAGTYAAFVNSLDTSYDAGIILLPSLIRVRFVRHIPTVRYGLNYCEFSDYRVMPNLLSTFMGMHTFAVRSEINACMIELERTSETTIYTASYSRTYKIVNANRVDVKTEERSYMIFWNPYSEHHIENFADNIRIDMTYFKSFGPTRYYD
jgi:hypothetical protein